ncbi:MAG: alpha,alpha-trehalose-phosphate synthase (UDP-forming) [Acidimicrobiales bacterium]
MAGGGADLVVVSNRGPVSFSQSPDGSLVARRGGGGVVSALTPLVRQRRATWVAAAISPSDRMAAATDNGVSETDGLRVKSLIIDLEDYAAAYDEISNTTLWFVHHGLFDLARQPRFDAAWRRAWEAYQRVNLAFAQAVATEAGPGATVLVQDYHLALVGSMVAPLRPDVACVHFTHIPFASAQELSVLPADVIGTLLEGMAAHRACGFHARTWEANFVACCETYGVGVTTKVRSFVTPIGADAQGLAAMASSEPAAAARRWLDSQVGDAMVVARVERVEPSKNLLRGLAAFDQLLTERPDLVGRVVLAAFVYSSRESLAAYRSYRAEAEAATAAINQRWGHGGWTPVLLDTSDDYARSVAALTRYDVLVVNPVRDGLNLVAMEGPLVNRRHGALVLSDRAGVHETLGPAALVVNPFDVGATAKAMARALDMDPGDRRVHAEGLNRAMSSVTTDRWLQAQMAASEG